MESNKLENLERRLDLALNIILKGDISHDSSHYEVRLFQEQNSELKANVKHYVGGVVSKSFSRRSSEFFGYDLGTKVEINDKGLTLHGLKSFGYDGDFSIPYSLN